MRRFILPLIILLGGAANVSPQSLINPSQLVFNHDDFARTSTYELGYYLVGAEAPIQTVVIPKTSVALAGVEYATSLPRPVFGTFVTRLRACAVDVNNAPICSPWSNTTNSFSLLPLAPVNAVIRP